MPVNLLTLNLILFSTIYSSSTLLEGRINNIHLSSLVHLITFIFLNTVVPSSLSLFHHSYRDLMREYSFSIIMAKWLSFLDNTSVQSNINSGMSSINGGMLSYPDENVSCTVCWDVTHIREQVIMHFSSYHYFLLPSSMLVKSCNFSQLVCIN